LPNRLIFSREHSSTGSNYCFVVVVVVVVVVVFVFVFCIIHSLVIFKSKSIFVPCAAMAHFVPYRGTF
jgi:hypothetical protein